MTKQRMLDPTAARLTVDRTGGWDAETVDRHRREASMVDTDRIEGGAR